MKKSIMVTLIILLFNSIGYAQSLSRRLKIVDVKCYDDGCILKTLDTIKLDTLYIESVKSHFKIGSRRKYQKVAIGGLYNFLLYSRDGDAQYLLTSNFKIKMKHTVVWRAGDDIKKVPFLAKNTNGLYITK